MLKKFSFLLFFCILNICHGHPIEGEFEEQISLKNETFEDGERSKRLDITDMDRVALLADQVTERLGRFLFQSGDGSSGLNFLSSLSGMNPLNLKLDKERIMRVIETLKLQKEWSEM